MLGAMPTRNISRTAEQRQREDALRLEALRAQLARGAAALDAGYVTDVDGRELTAYIASLAPASSRRPGFRRPRPRAPRR